MGRWVVRTLGTALLIAGCFAGTVLAGTTGKLSGRVTDKKKQPLTGVNIAVVGMPLGAATDAEGRYTILNIPPGRISVKAALIGYGPVLTQNVDITSDNTTRLDVELAESAVQMQEVVVSARKPVVEVNRTSNIATVSREQLQTLPVQELTDIVNLQAGVVDGHFRGGRDDEVQYQVDGVSVNNAYDNKASLRLDRSLLEEVQVISGTFDAEYGQAMSGVVNAVLKRGGEKFRWDLEVFTGGPVYSNGTQDWGVQGLAPYYAGGPLVMGVNTRRIIDGHNRLASQQNFQASMNGPTLIPRTTYLLSARHYKNDDWVRGARYFNPWDKADVTNHILYPSGDGKGMPLGWSDEWSGVVKVTNRLIPNVELSWQAIFDKIEARAVNWGYRFEPDGTKKQHTLSVVEGLDLTHTLSPTRFYSVSVRQNYKDYADYAFESVWDKRYDEWGAPQSFDFDYGITATTQGVDLDRFKQNTNGVVLKASFVDQVAKDHQLKVGGEFQWPHIQFGSPGYVIFNSSETSGGAQVIQRRTTYDPKFPGVLEYVPLIGAAFAQEEVEWNDLTLRGGVRMEYFSARSTYPSDLANPANSIAGVPLSHPVMADPKVTFAPRLGVSYPISEHASLFFAYGHFYQLPGLGQIFKDSDYDRLKDLQATDTSVPVMGNPNIRPEKTVQYQFGYKHAVTDYLGLDVTTYYKDVRDLLGTEILETYNGAQYARLANVDFGSVVGFTVTITQRAKGMIGSKLDYTWQSAMGNSSDPQETATRAAAGEDARPRSIPFNWDQKHTLNYSLSVAKPDQFNVNATFRIASGQPYTPTITTGFSGGLEKNSGRKPVSTLVDLRADHVLPRFGSSGRAFVRVFNLFDTRFQNDFVFDSSGDPYYSRFPGKDLGRLLDPTRYYAPRRIEVGLTLSASK